jgi:hypothetical protein
VNPKVASVIHKITFLLAVFQEPTENAARNSTISWHMAIGQVAQVRIYHSK